MEQLKIEIKKIPANVSAVDVALVLAAAGLKLGKPVEGTCMDQLTLEPLPEAGGLVANSRKAH